MHSTNVLMKSGQKHSGPIMLFRPKEGFLTLMGDDPGPDVKLYFRDMLSCVTEDERISINIIGDEDQLERARKMGWDGK